MPSEIGGGILHLDNISSVGIEEKIEKREEKRKRKKEKKEMEDEPIPMRFWLSNGKILRIRGEVCLCSKR